MTPAPQHALSRRDLAAVASVILLWGLTFVAMKVALRHFTPLQFGCARFVLSFLPLALWVRPPGVGLRWLLPYGLLQGVGQSALVFFSLKVGMSAALVPVVMQTQVFATALLGVALLHERLSSRQKAGLAIAAAGLGCLALNALLAPGGTEVTLLGIALAVAAASLLAGSNLVAKALNSAGRRCDPLALVVWSSPVSIVAFALLSALFDDASVRWQWTGAPPLAWAAVLFTSWGGNVVAYWLWNGLLRRHPVSRVAPFTLGVPVMGLVAGVVLLGEAVNAWQLGGAVLVMSALWFVVGRRA